MKAIEFKHKISEFNKKLTSIQDKYESMEGLKNTLTENIEAAQLYSKLSFVYATLYLTKSKLDGNLKSSNKVKKL